MRKRQQRQMEMSRQQAADRLQKQQEQFANETYSSQLFRKIGEGQTIEEMEKTEADLEVSDLSEDEIEEVIDPATKFMEVKRAYDRLLQLDDEVKGNLLFDEERLMAEKEEKRQKKIKTIQEKYKDKLM